MLEIPLNLYKLFTQYQKNFIHIRMSTSNVSSASIKDQVFPPTLTTRIDKNHPEIEGLSQRTQSIWDRIYGATIGVVPNTIVPAARSSIGAAVRDPFFFPSQCFFMPNRQEIQKKLQAEETYCRNFWDPTEELDTNFPDQAKIREKFAPPEDRTFSIQLKDRKNVEITCRILQTKAEGESHYNFVLVPGTYATISNTVKTIYPYLSAYLNSEKGGVVLPPARFIVISENNLNFKPATLDEAGLVLLETLKALKEEFGDFDQLVAHSLGTVFFANVLKQVHDPKMLPKHICLDRGPTSIWEASKKYFWGFGRLIYVLADFGGWASDIEQDVVGFCQKWEERPSLVVIGLQEDHHFSGSANLGLGKKIKKIPGVQTLVFAPTQQITNESGQHTMRADSLNRLSLIKESKESDFIQPSESLSQALIRHSLRS